MFCLRLTRRKLVLQLVGLAVLMAIAYVLYTAEKRRESLSKAVLTVTDSYSAHLQSVSVSQACEKIHRLAVNTSDFFVFIHSAVKNVDRREAMRNTWLLGNVMKPCPIAHVFLLGMPHGNLTEEDLQALHNEFSTNDDVLVMSTFTDGYFNLTYKTLTMLDLIVTCDMQRWTQRVLKSDDDIFVNLPMLSVSLNTLHEDGNSSFIAGYLNQNATVHRDPKDKYYISESEYAASTYPPFVSGAAYLISTNAASVLLRMSRQVPPIRLEDVYLAVMADIANVKMLGLPHVYMGSLPSWDLMSGRAVAHYINPTTMRRFWKDWRKYLENKANQRAPDRPR